MFIGLRCHRALLALVLLLLAAPAAWATSWTVNSAADPAIGSASNCAAGNPNTCTLRDAIAAAGNSDTITFASSAMLITLTSTNLLMLSQTMLTIDGGGVVVVDGNLTTQVFEVASGANITLTGLTIRKGKTSFYGGGIYNEGTLTVSDTTLSGNNAGDGGGAIFNSNGGTVTLTRSTLSGNSAYVGGAIYNYNAGTIILIQSMLSDNFAGSDGGGIYNDVGTLTLNNSRLSGNLAVDGGRGGGIFNSNAGTIILANSTLSDNAASASGGGIYNRGNSALSNSTLSGNAAYDFDVGGGGIYNQASLTLANSTLFDNSANLGGGVYNQASLTLTNSTLSDNSANLGGGIYNNGGTVTLTNTILNQVSGNGSACAGGLPIDQGGNLDSGISCNVSSARSNATINLGLLQNNGGPTQTLLPGADSQAIDGIACTNAPPTDQRGVTRPQGAICDIGAVEVKQAALTVQVSDVGNGNNRVTATAGAMAVSPMVGINLCGSESGSCTAYYNTEGSPAPSVTLTLAPTTGWHVVSVTSDTCAGSLSGDPYTTATYTTAALTASCTVSVNFAVSQTSSPPPVPVPSLSVWLLLLLGGVLLGAGVRTATRRK
jgi:CSLREA domain-containing protein